MNSPGFWDNKKQADIVILKLNNLKKETTKIKKCVIMIIEKFMYWEII